jgi:hypothetical protein
MAYTTAICQCDSCRLARIESMLERLISQGVIMSAELDQLTTQVQNTRDVEDSAIALLNGLSAQIRAMQNDPAKLTQLANDLQAKAGDLAAAVTANTPQASTGGTTPTGGSTPA